MADRSADPLLTVAEVPKAMSAEASAQDTILTEDGARLPLRSWRPSAEGPIRAVLLAIHGFNDYSGVYETLGPALTEHRIALYAYDQRGFGATRDRGVWPGHATLVADLVTVAAAVRPRHPEAPFYLLGESMGAAVAMLALADRAAPLRRTVAGVVFVSAAVWGGKALNPVARAMLLAFGALLPRVRMTKPYSEARLPSDNRAMLEALWHDPLAITSTRISAVAGLVRLVDAAMAIAPNFDVPGLVLFGDQDRVNPPASVKTFLKLLPPGRQRVVFYPDGWHMLLRDTQAEVVIGDIVAWLDDPATGKLNGREIS